MVALLSVNGAEVHLTLRSGVHLCKAVGTSPMPRLSVSLRPRSKEENRPAGAQHQPPVPQNQPAEGPGSLWLKSLRGRLSLSGAPSGMQYATQYGGAVQPGFTTLEHNIIIPANDPKQ